MKEVEVDADDQHWPQKCCRCGGKAFSIREYMEKVVIWSTGAVTKYDLVLLHIPVCGTCASVHKIWLGAAAALGAIGFIANNAGKSIGFVLFWLVSAIVLALVGVNKKPIKVLRFDKTRNRLRIRIYHDAVAAELIRMNGGGGDKRR